MTWNSSSCLYCQVLHGHASPSLLTRPWANASHMHVNNTCTYSFCSSADCAQGLFRDMALISEYFAFVHTLAQKAGGDLHRVPQPYCLHEPHFFRSYSNNSLILQVAKQITAGAKRTTQGFICSYKDKNGSWSCFSLSLTQLMVTRQEKERRL